MDTEAPQGGTIRDERRLRPDLRKVFEESIDRLAPFFNSGMDSSDTPMEYWAARTLREMHPELTTQDIRVLVNSAYRYHKEMRNRALSGQTAPETPDKRSAPQPAEA